MQNRMQFNWTMFQKVEHTAEQAAKTFTASLNEREKVEKQKKLSVKWKFPKESN